MDVPNLRWLNLLFTSSWFIFTGLNVDWILVNAETPRKYVILNFARLCLVWVTICLIWFVWELWYIWAACGAAAVFLYWGEYHLLRAIIHEQACSPNAIERAWVLLDPLNYLIDGVGRAQSANQPMLYRLAHWVFCFFRVVGLTILICIGFVHHEFITAWSCYKHAPIEDFVLGYCPAYSHNFHDQWVCSDPRYRFSRGCMDEPPNASWDSQPRTVHFLLLLFTIDLAVYAITSLYLDLEELPPPPGSMQSRKLMP
jgi:hypothetical protein